MLSAPARQRLLEAVQDPRQRGLVDEILTAAGTALASLAHLESTIFERRTETGAFHVDILISNPEQIERAISFLARLADHLFTPTLRLARLIEAKLVDQVTPSAEPDLDSFDFDMGQSERTGSILRSIGDADLDDALVPVIADSPRGVKDEELASALVPLASALIGEIEDIRKRTENALHERNPVSALRELDASREAFEEATCAILDALCQVLHVDITRRELVPTYSSALEDALAIRRAIAELRRVVQAANGFVQQPALPVEERAHALSRILEALSNFLAGDVLVRMRASDRWEFLEFAQEIEGKGPDEARLAAEGFAKYLDSLSAINDRRVLIEHDRAAFQTLRENIEAGDSIVSVSEHAAVDIYAEALSGASQLLGWRDDLDEIILKWSLSSRSAEDVMSLVAKLRDVVPS